MDSEEMMSIAQMLADGGCQPGELMALAKKFYNRRNQTTQRPTRPAPSPSRPTGGDQRRPIRCGNCGETGHISADCKKPRVDPKDRPCFECGKVGHTAARCPNKRDGKKSNVNNLDDDSCHYAMCLEDDQGFSAVRRGAKPRPMPSMVTMEDVLDKAFGR